MPSVNSPTLTWLEDLETSGFAVVKNAVPKDRAARYVESMYGWLEKFPFGFRKDDKSTWTEKHLPKSMKGGMYHKYAVGHEKFVWDARLEPGVIGAFTQVWGTEKLLVSFDGINMTFPHPKTSAQRWPHVDQNPHIVGKQCIQGILNLAPNGPNDGGLMVMKNSKQHFEEFFTMHSKEKNPKWGLVPDDWHGFDDDEVKWFEEKGCEIKKVDCGPGDLVLWDSRSVHWNVLPTGQTTRSVVYLCYTPAKFATEADLEIKKDLLAKWQRTTHWPHRNFWREDDATEGGITYGRTEPFEKPELTETLLKLSGVIPY